MIWSRAFADSICATESGTPVTVRATMGSAGAAPDRFARSFVKPVTTSKRRVPQRFASECTDAGRDASLTSQPSSRTCAAAA